MAGVPFEPLQDLATPRAVEFARQLLNERGARDEAAAQAEEFFRSRERLLAPAPYNSLRRAVRSLTVPEGDFAEQPPIFTRYATAARAVAETGKTLQATLEAELQAARTSLIQSTRAYLEDYLLFGAESVSNQLAKQLADYPTEPEKLSPRHNAARKVEQSLLLYLQRVAAKNDTFSRFGPSAWGVNDSGQNIAFAPEQGIARHEIFFERWVAHALAGAMNADPEIFADLMPRKNPAGRLEGDDFLFTDSGERVALSEDAVAIVQCADGKTPAYQIDSSLEELRELVSRKILICRVEVPALEPHAVDDLRSIVGSWRNNSATVKWRTLLDRAAELAGEFAPASPLRRHEILSEARALLRSVVGEPRAGQRFLYSATNVIGEECFRVSNLVLAEQVIDEVPEQAAPWIDFWRDTYAFVASRVAGGLGKVFANTSGGRAAMLLPEFMLACEKANLPLTSSGLVILAARAFHEVKTAFRERLRPHAHLEEYELTEDDCHVVRNSFEYPKFDEYTYPSADLQLSAESFDAVRLGDYQWIIGELHPPAAMLHHGFYWGCPDYARLREAFAASVFGRPNFHFGFFAADFTAHTTVRIFDALPDLTYFVAPQRGKPEWKTVRPADAEVFVDENSGDVGVRHRESHEFLGSFARAWLIPLGFHPFQFGFAPHTPRLRCGNVVVQRRAWTVRMDELSGGDFTGVSADLVLAMEKLRSEKGWPRYIYTRPTEQALRRSGAEGRDKDTKPIFVDLESYLSLEIFYRWLKKAGELEVTEMFPDADHLCWQESDGRRTFELRTLIVPRT